MTCAKSLQIAAVNGKPSRAQILCGLLQNQRRQVADTYASILSHLVRRDAPCLNRIGGHPETGRHLIRFP